MHAPGDGGAPRVAMSSINLDMTSRLDVELLTGTIRIASVVIW
jgi:hypothetical protein